MCVKNSVEGKNSQCYSTIARSKKIKFLLFSIVLLVSSYFYNHGSWGPVSQYNAIFSFVENESNDFLTFRIDRFMIAPRDNVNTGNWVQYNGHFYSNRPPGMIILGALVYLPIYYFERLIYSPPFPLELDVINAYIINFCLSALLLAFAAVYFTKTLMLVGISLKRSVVFSLILTLCTPLLPLSNSLEGYATVIALIIFALYRLLVPKKRNINLFLSGLFLGLAAICDYMASIYIISFIILIICWERRKVLWLLLGGIPPLLLWIWYNWLCFGSPFRTATAYSNSLLAEYTTWEIANISTYRMLQLLFSPDFGLLIASPVLLFAFFGYYKYLHSMKNIKRCQLKEQLLWLSAVGIFLILMISSGFNRGFSAAFMNPGLLIITLPLWMLPIALANYRGIRCWLLILLSTLSFCNMLIFAALASNLPQSLSGLYSKFFSAQFQTECYLLKLHFLNNSWSQWLKWSSFNLGNIIGLSGMYSLIPLILILTLLVSMIITKLSFCNNLSPKTLYSSISSIIFWIRKQSGFLFVLLIIGFIVTLLFPGDAVWINDEPLLIGKAYASNAAGQWCSSGLKGTVGMTYGPVAIWLYQLIMLFTQKTVLMVFFKTLITLTVLLYACIKISRYTKINFAYAGILLMVSPYLYFYNRILWDNVLLIPLIALSFAYFLEFFERKNWIAWFAGVFIAFLCLYLHPMSLPWLIGVIAVSLICNWKFFLQKYNRSLLFTCSFALPGIPYLYKIATQFSFSSSSNININQVFISVITVGKNLTFYGYFDYFLPEYLKTYPKLALFIRVFSVTQLILIWIMFIVAIFLFIREYNNKKSLNTCNVALLYCFAVLFLHSLMTLVLRRSPHPHYNNAITFICLFITWRSIDYLVKRRLLKYIIYSFFLFSLGMMIILISLIHTNEGTRGIHYGATINNQWKVIGGIADDLAYYKEVSLNCKEISNYRLFPQALSVMVELHRSSNKPILPRKQERAIIKVIYPRASPSGKISILSRSQGNRGGFKQSSFE